MFLTLPAAYRDQLDAVQKIRGQHEALSLDLARAEFAITAAIVRSLFGTLAARLLVDFREDVHGNHTIEALVLLDDSANPLWFNSESRYDCWDYPGADAVSDDRGRPLVTLDGPVVDKITGHLEDGYEAYGGVSGPLDATSDKYFPDAENLLVLDIAAALDQPATTATDPPAADSAHPVTVSVARTDTPTFQLTAIGRTPEQAREALIAAWRKHAAATGEDPDYVSWDYLRVITGPIGAAFRDDDPMT